MQARFAARPVLMPATFVGQAALLLLPSALLLGASLRAPVEHQQPLWFGTVFLAGLSVVAMLAGLLRRRELDTAFIFFYGLGLGWLVLATQEMDNDWYVHLSQAVMLVVPLGAFALGMLGDIGAPALRRARVLAQRLADRKDWPSDLDACRTLPEVKALREALHLDARPALGLLQHPRPQVQIAALAALDFRKNWGPGQAELVMQVALRAEEPAVRAAALSALANIEDRVLIESLAEFLRDPSPQVRRAATQAVLWDAHHRWSWIRHAVRRSLGDPLCQDDGPLRPEGNLLTQEAVDDLTAWAAEKGLLGLRAALTLGIYYAQALGEAPDAELIDSLRAQLDNPHTPAVLRIELARLLQSSNALNEEGLRKLLDPANPAPLRLIAVESLLGESEAPEAITALRDLARLPNREIALATADVVQRRLHVDMGLVPGQPLPPVHSRQATMIGRRVKAWANHEEMLGLEPPPLAVSRIENRTWHSMGEI